MQCKRCGTEIADKAIVCFRCGAATTDPVRKAVLIAPQRNRLLPIAAIVVLLVVAIVMGYVSRTAANPELPQLAAGLALGAATAILLLAVLRHR